jgi:hypothetical protein
MFDYKTNYYGKIYHRPMNVFSEERIVSRGGVRINHKYGIIRGNRSVEFNGREVNDFSRQKNFTSVDGSIFGAA